MVFFGSPKLFRKRNLYYEKEDYCRKLEDEYGSVRGR